MTDKTCEREGGVTCNEGCRCVFGLFWFFCLLRARGSPGWLTGFLKVPLQSLRLKRVGAQPTSVQCDTSLTTEAPLPVCCRVLYCSLVYRLTLKASELLSCSAPALKTSAKLPSLWLSGLPLIAFNWKRAVSADVCLLCTIPECSPFTCTDGCKGKQSDALCYASEVNA